MVRWAMLAVALASVVLVGVLALQRSRGPTSGGKYCAGVGFDGPTAASPDEALAAWLAVSPGTGSVGDWERSDGYGRSEATDVYYEQIEPNGSRVTSPRGIAVRVVSARRGKDGWSVDGGCV